MIGASCSTTMQLGTIASERGYEPRRAFSFGADSMRICLFSDLPQLLLIFPDRVPFYSSRPPHFGRPSHFGSPKNGHTSRFLTHPNFPHFLNPFPHLRLRRSALLFRPLARCLSIIIPIIVNGTFRVPFAPLNPPKIGGT